MKRAIIFANGSLDSPATIIRSLLPADLVIAADGGTQHCQVLGITPGVIIGDFDSINPEQVAFYKQAGVVMLTYPSRKNETDLELALQYALSQNVGETYILGALGARWDMTVANILLMAHPRFAALKIHLLDGIQELILLRGKGQYDLQGQPGNPISLMPLAGDAHGVTTHGLEYPLSNETLYFGASRGVSNGFVSSQARIALSEGLLLCILNWAGF